MPFREITAGAMLSGELYEDVMFCVACKSIESSAWAALEQRPCVPDSHALPSTKNEEHTIIVGRC